MQVTELLRPPGREGDAEPGDRRAERARAKLAYPPTPVSAGAATNSTL